MLEQLSIRNFQKHERLVIDFDSRITTIVGESDIGKSSILRALEWVCRNTPSGDAFVRHDASFTSVALTVDGHRIKRGKGKSNYYRINGSKLVAFGSSVPDRIADVINISDVNFQHQLAGPYWLIDTPGQVSRNLNQIVSLEVIDKSLAHIAAEGRRAKTEVEIIAGRLKQAKSDQKALDWVPAFEASLVRLEKWERRLELKRTTIAALTSAIEDIRNAKHVVRSTSPSILDGLAAIRVGEKLAKRAEHAQALQSLIRQIEKAEDAWQQSKSNVVKLTKKLKIENCPICGRPITAK